MSLKPFPCHKCGQPITILDDTGGICFLCYPESKAFYEKPHAVHDAVVQHAQQLKNEAIVAAVEYGLRKDEIASLRKERQRFLDEIESLKKQRDFWQTEKTGFQQSHQGYVEMLREIEMLRRQLQLANESVRDLEQRLSQKIMNVPTAWDVICEVCFDGKNWWPVPSLNNKNAPLRRVRLKDSSPSDVAAEEDQK